MWPKSHPLRELNRMIYLRHDQNHLVSLLAPKICLEKKRHERWPGPLSLCPFPATGLGSPGGSDGKESAYQCRRGKRGGFDSWVGKIPLEEEMATHSNILAWRIPWAKKPGRMQSMGSQRVGHNWAATRTTTQGKTVLARINGHVGKELSEVYWHHT